MGGAKRYPSSFCSGIDGYRFAPPILQTTASIGSIPSTTTRPIATMDTAKTQFVRQPQRNRLLLRSIAYHRHDRPAAGIDPVVLRAITISWNNIGIPVGSWPYDGHPDDGPFPWFTNDLGGLRLRCGTKRAQVTQDQGRSQGDGRYPHASTSLPRTAHTQLGYPGDVRVRAAAKRYIGHQRLNRNV